MSGTLSTVYSNNPITSVADDDLLYVDVGPGADAAIKRVDFVRKKLNANITLNIASGNPAPFNNLLNAWNYVCNSIDIAGYEVFIDGGGHTYTDSIVIPNVTPATPTGGGKITFKNIAAWNAGAHPCFSTLFTSIGSALVFDFTTGSGTVSNTSGGGFCFGFLGAANVQFKGVGCTGADAGFVSAATAATVYVSADPYTLSGTIPTVFQQNRGGYIYLDGGPGTSTIATAAGGFSMTQFTYSYGGGMLESYSGGNPYPVSGSFSGLAYDVQLNGVINTFGGGNTYFPGGSFYQSTGGEYA